MGGRGKQYFDSLKNQQLVKKGQLSGSGLGQILYSYSKEPDSLGEMCLCTFFQVGSLSIQAA